MSDDKIFEYEGEEIDVSWDGRLCIHVGECGRADNDLFVGGRKPWCVPDEVDEATVVDVVKRCPTGALAYRSHDGDDEEADERNVVVVSNNGPLYVRGNLNIDGAADDMPGVKFRAALCRCGLSKNKPFCDNTHEDAGFRDRGAVGKTATEPLEELIERWGDEVEITRGIQDETFGRSLLVTDPDGTIIQVNEHSSH